MSEGYSPLLRCVLFVPNGAASQPSCGSWQETAGTALLFFATTRTAGTGAASSSTLGTPSYADATIGSSMLCARRGGHKKRSLTRMWYWGQNVTAWRNLRARDRDARARRLADSHTWLATRRAVLQRPSVKRRQGLIHASPLRWMRRLARSPASHLLGFCWGNASCKFYW